MQIENYETLIVERDGAVDTLWLNRPNELNVIMTPMVTELRHYFDHLTADAMEGTRAFIEKRPPVYQGH